MSDSQTEERTARVDAMLVEWPFTIHFGVTRQQLTKIGFAF